ncbi:MAG: hypothetical protein WBS19_15805, partial [Candidatus Korobacteraceae bacterium]
MGIYQERMRAEDVRGSHFSLSNSIARIFLSVLLVLSAAVLRIVLPSLGKSDWLFASVLLILFLVVVSCFESIVGNASKASSIVARVLAWFSHVAGKRRPTFQDVSVAWNIQSAGYEGLVDSLHSIDSAVREQAVFSGAVSHRLDEFIARTRSMDERVQHLDLAVGRYLSEGIVSEGISFKLDELAARSRSVEENLQHQHKTSAGLLLARFAALEGSVAHLEKMLIQQTQTSERILYLLESSYPEPQQALKPLGMRRYPIATGNIWREFDELSMGLNRLKSERHEEFERFCLDARKHTVILPRTDVDITALWSKVFRQVGFKVEIVSPSELLDPLEELREPIKSDFILLWDSRDHRETDRAFV